MKHPTFPSNRLRIWPIALVAVCFLGAALNLSAAYRETIGYNRLVTELQLRGLPVPTGAGLRVTQVEAPANEAGDYRPNPSNAEFTGISFHLQSGTSGNSNHATTAGQVMYGSATSMAYGISDVDVYQTNDWISGKGYGGINPMVDNNPLQNHSWVGTGPDTISRSLDFAAERDGFLAVVGMPNSSTDIVAVPTVYAQTYNTLSVGLSNGNHKSGLTTSDGTGRIKPEIVGVNSATSFATPQVTAAAALLIEAAGTNTNARHQLSLKAILLAAADKSSFAAWSRTPTQPIDTHFGAGRLDVYESYWIQQAGQQGHGAGAIGPRGWDFSTISGIPRNYSLSVPDGFRLEDVSVLLTWNRSIDVVGRGPTRSFSVTTYNLNLTLRDNDANVVDESTSDVQNIEHLWISGNDVLEAGNYTLEVFQTSSGTNVPYALAWRGRLVQDFELWAETVFPAGTDAADMTPAADPDGDGVVNLMEYALGTDPLSPSTADLPTPLRLTIGDDQFLALSYPRPPHDNGVTYTVETSEDLQSWSSAPGDVVAVSITPHPDGVREIHTYRRAVPITAEDRGFLRLRVDGDF